jgi:PAS domain S-box-containing protein
MSGLAHAGAPGELDVRRLRTLYKLLAVLSRARALEDVYHAALTSLLEATTANRAAILIFDEDGVIRFKAAHGLSREYQEAVTGHSPWTRGALDTQPLVIPDAMSDQRVARYHRVLAREGIRALVFVPLAFDAGVIGKFMLYYDQPYECTSDELEVSRAIASHVALATEHKRAELARVRSEQRLQAILDNSATVIFLKDLQGRYLLVNRRYEEVFHVAKTDVIGRTDHDIFPREFAQRFEANDRAVLAAGGPLALEEYAPQDDGFHTYISIKFPLEGPDGTVAGVCSIATDITERKQLEAASQRLAAIVESSNEAIIGKDLNGRITSWNAGAERLFGYTAAEAVGQTVSMLAAPGHQNEMPEILSQVRQGYRVEHYETQRRRKDGQIIDVALTVSPVRNAAGQIIGASKIARDITERKLGEQERSLLLSREKEARQTAELLNRIGPRLVAQLDMAKLSQEVTDIATALVGAEFGSFFHHVTKANGESYMLCTLSGTRREDFAGFSMPTSNNLFGNDFRAEGIVRCDDVIQEPRYSETLPPFGLPKEHLPVRSYLAVPVIARSGEVLGGLFFCHSLPARFTETHQEIMAGVAAQAAIAMDNARLFEQAQWTQAELKRSNEELRRANKDLEVFAYSASHDLKDPLRTIAISAQLLERNLGQQLQGENSTFLSNILTATNRMSALIQDLLSYSRATKFEEGAPPCVDSGQVLAEVLDSLRGPIEEAGATVIAGELPLVAMHKGRLAQVLQNLVSNAIKYRGKGVPQVRIAAEERDGWCVFSVTDNGIGIAPQFAEQIFGLFKRLHHHDEYPGSGIGLAICQRIVEQYGGRIWLEQSAFGRGSTFCFAVPWRAPQHE